MAKVRWILVALGGITLIVAGCKTVEDGYGANKAKQEAKTEKMMNEQE